MTQPERTLLPLRVSPNARADSLRRDGEEWRLAVAAPPVDGAANERVCTFLAREVLGIPKSAVRVKAGAAGRRKLVEIDLAPERVATALEAWVSRA